MKTFLVYMSAIAFQVCVVQAAEVPRISEWHGKPGESFRDPESSFKATLELLESSYVDKALTKEDLYRAATAGMLEALNENGQVYNELLTPEQIGELESNMVGKIIGVGLSIKWQDETGNGLVLETLPGSPAEAAGIKSGDIVLSIEGQHFKGQTLADMVNAIRGKAGQSVKIKLLRDEQVKSFTVQRAEVLVDNLEFENVNADFAYMRVGYFQNSTAAQVAQKLTEVSQSGKKKLIVDLRDNTGGIFDGAVETAEAFSPVGKGEQLVASTKNRDGSLTQYKAAKGKLADNVKIVVLANEATSSGAELLLEALRENRHAKIVGTKTHGKWTAQTIKTLPNHFAVKYTVEAFQSPSGQSFQGAGVQPDFAIDLPKEAQGKSYAKLSFAQRLEADAQLKAAADLVKAF